MKNAPSSISTCRNCRNYSPVGRRGGDCQKLDIPVQGRWKACSLAIPALSKWKDWDLVMEVSPIAVNVITADQWTLPPQPDIQIAVNASAASSEENSAVEALEACMKGVT